MKKRLIVDMDGVIVDIYAQFLTYEFNETGISRNVEDLVDKTEREAFVNVIEYVNTKGFFRNAMVMEGSQEALKLLNEKYELFIVSSAMEFPPSLPDKYDWLQEYFPFTSWKNIVFCGSKSVVQGDIMIDDHFKNLDTFTGKTILFTQPHNHKLVSDKHVRVNNWQEILEILS